MIRAVLFDLDETLIPDESVSRAAAHAAAEHAGDRADAAAVASAALEEARRLWAEGPLSDYCGAIGISAWEGLWGRFTGVDPRLRALRDWTAGYRIASWGHGLRACGVDDPDLAAAISARFRRERLERLGPYPETEETLDALRHAYPLGMITNGAPDVQRDKINRVGFGACFAVILISGEYGYGKPDPRLFETALSIVNAEPGEAVMIGDNPHRDMAGARAAGIRSIRIHRHGEAAPGPDPDAWISTLDALPEMLRTW